MNIALVVHLTCPYTLKTCRRTWFWRIEDNGPVLPSNRDESGINDIGDGRT